jgi:hypothetical protein
MLEDADRAKVDGRDARDPALGKLDVAELERAAAG